MLIARALDVRDKAKEVMKLLRIVRDFLSDQVPQYIMRHSRDVNVSPEVLLSVLYIIEVFLEISPTSSNNRDSFACSV
jgi:hypothetical protein